MALKSSQIYGIKYLTRTSLKLSEGKDKVIEGGENCTIVVEELLRLTNTKDPITNDRIVKHSK